MVYLIALIALFSMFMPPQLLDSCSAVFGYTGDLTSGGTPTASGGTAGNAFDDAVGTIVSTGANTGWVAYEFASPYKICRYEIIGPTTTNAAPRDWTFEYWDGSAYQVVDTRTGQTGWTSGQIRTFDIASSLTAYRWRLNVTLINGGTSVGVAELRMMESGLAPTPTPTSAPTSTPSPTPAPTEHGYTFYNMKGVAGHMGLWPLLIIAFVIGLAVYVHQQSQKGG